LSWFTEPYHMVHVMHRCKSAFGSTSDLYIRDKYAVVLMAKRRHH